MSAEAFFSTCARCNAPIRLDPSIASQLQQSHYDMLASHVQPPALADVSPAQLARMPTSMQAAYVQQQQHKSAVSKRPLPRKPAAVAESFIVLGESQLRLPAKDAAHDGKRPSAHRLALSQKLFEMLSTHADVDHPLCIDCADTLQDMMQKQARGSTV
jgi:beclin 1